MDLTVLDLQIVEKIRQFKKLNNKEIAEKLNKDHAWISRRMKQLVEKQVVNKERIRNGKIKYSYYSLNDDIDNLKQIVKVSNFENEVSIPSEVIYDADNINLRETILPRPKRDIEGVSTYPPRQLESFSDTLSFLEIHTLFTEVLKYLSIESKSRKLTSKEARLVKILSEDSSNYRWVLDCIVLFLNTAQKIKIGED